MGFNASKYESQIRAILQAPGVDLSTISAKRVRKELLDQNEDLTPELVKDHKDEFDALIGKVYEQVSADAGDGEEEGDEEAGSAEEDTGKRKREEDDEPEVPPPKAKKTKKAKKGEEDGAAPVKRKRTKKAKSAETVDSEGEGGSQEGEPKKKKGGFTKEYALSEPLAKLLAVDKLSRPQVVKHLWDYIKSKGLQNPENKKEIICDDKLKSIFNCDRIGMFTMNKVLGQHLREATAA